MQLRKFLLIILGIYSSLCSASCEDRYDLGYADGAASARRAVLDCIRSIGGTALDAADECE